MVALSHALSLVYLALSAGWAQVTHAASPAYDWPLTAAQHAELARGAVVVLADRDSGHPAGEVRAAVQIAAPAERIFRTMTDCAEALEFVPHLKGCRVLETAPDGSWQIVAHAVQYRWYMPRTDYVFRAEYEPFTRIRFMHVSGDLREHEGMWEIRPARDSRGAASIVTYRVRMVPRFYVPLRMVRASLRGDLPELLRALRRKCELTGEE